ncbi:SusC/RagA family TonB-linked outer membrane protein [Hymenobacter metallilatus]|uniref:SusC/RagA family TonB-linked outer membrane protein n=1 Tax=Hymenobacter metallilatus TaxID=2493666 RepID=A0A428IZ05_9BACT|nr:SusC/RagA family TonB-linked outer membrane protein [Hymenobacter metallilatus]RSK24278.1 SusC/RagA family TonB-linked outer membrane protein [Hymenobacter metallilatus]
MKHHYLLGALLLALSVMGHGQAQTRTISGRVLDATTKEGLPGVSVIVKGSTIGTATNAEGQYTLNIPASATTLVVKQLGFSTQEVSIGSNAVLDVTLAVNTEQLSEVIVTAAGIQREKRALGYAVSEIKNEQVVQKSEPDVLRTLQGKIPGVNITSASGVPGSSTRITIRGNSSLQRNNQPLFIVDGIPFNNDQLNSDNPLVRGAGYSNRAADLDPNNIESMNVLKGGAAAALYGSRGANGVIVITTKTGSKKRAQKGVKVDYSSAYSLEKIANLPQYQNSYGSGANFAYGTTNGSWGPRFGTIAPVQHPLATLPELQTAFPEYVDQTYDYKAYPDNVKDFFDTGRLFENSITLTGATDNATFTSVVSRADQQGMIPESNFIRNSISAGGSSQFNKLRIGGSVTYTNSNQQGPQLGANNAIGNASAFARILFQPRNMDLMGLPTTNPLTKGSVYGWLTGQADNPLWSVENNRYTSQVDRVISNVSLGYDINSWLSLSYVGGVNTYTEARRTTIRPGSVGAGGVGNILEDNIRNTELEQTLLLTADRNLNEDISLRAVLGHNINQRQYESTSFSGNKITVFGIDNISNTQEIFTNGAGYSKRRLFGVLGDVTLGYKDWAYLNLTGRNDWSSTLPTSNRSFFYPSAGVSFVFTDAFDLKYNWLNLGKVRASISRTGNDADPYSLSTQYTINPSYGNNAGSTDFPFRADGVSFLTPGASFAGTIGNPNLTPEFTTSTEVGLDLGFLKDRVALEATYYNRHTTNQISPIQIPTSTGFSQYLTNFGEVSNKGVELGLTLVPVQTENFGWNSYTTFAHNLNLIEELAPGLDQLPLNAPAFAGGPQAIHFAPKDGKKYQYGLIYGSVAARDDNGNLLINPKTGALIEATEFKVIGNPNPKFQMGFTNSFRWKWITLNTVVDYRYGGDLYSTTIQSLIGRGVTKDTEDRERLVLIKGVLADPNNLQQPQRNSDGSTIPNNRAISVNDLYFQSAGGSIALNSPDEYSIFEATTVRLREVTLAFAVPTKWVEKAKIGALTVSFSGRNLYWYSPNLPKYTNFDPETSSFSNSNAQGFEYTNAPTARRYGMNLRVTF